MVKLKFHKALKRVNWAGFGRDLRNWLSASDKVYRLSGFWSFIRLAVLFFHGVLCLLLKGISSFFCISILEVKFVFDSCRLMPLPCKTHYFPPTCQNILTVLESIQCKNSTEGCFLYKVSAARPPKWCLSQSKEYPTVGIQDLFPLCCISCLQREGLEDTNWCGLSGRLDGWVPLSHCFLEPGPVGGPEQILFSSECKLM